MKYNNWFCFNRVVVPPRKGSKKIQLKGIFVGAKVVRGPDWEWGQQDGGEGKRTILFYGFIFI